MNQKTLPQNIKDYSIETTRASIKVYLSVLGPLGTALDEILFGIGERVRGKRLEEFVKILSEQLDEIKKNKINKSFFESENFYDLSISIFNSAVKTQSKEKIILLSSVYINSINSEVEWESDLTQIFIKYINELTVKHILVFKYIVRNIASFSQVDSYQQIHENFCDKMKINHIDKYEFRMYLRDLENKTLLRFSPDINEFGSSGGYIALESYEEVSGIILTSIGDSFCKIMKNNFA